MTKEITPMNAGVAAIPWTELSHRKIQDEWFKHIRFDDGKPHLQAMFLLSDVVYCYQPRVVEDPRTGIVLCYERRFEGEMLQRDAEYYERYGFTEKQYRTALDRLCEIGVCFRVTVAKVDFVDGNGATRTRYSVPYIGLDTQILYEITVPVEIRYLLVQRGGGALQGRGGVPYRASGDYIYTKNYNISPTDVSQSGSDPFFGKTAQDIFGKRSAQIAAEQNKLLIESMALPWEQWHALVSKVTDIHGLTSAVETMKDDKSLQKMQDLTNRLALAGVDTQEKVWGLYQSWLKTTPLGKKAAKGNKRPLGSNLTDHASDLIDRGIMINGIIVSAQLGNSTGTQSGGVEGGDIDYTALAEQSSTVGLSEVPLGFSDN